MAKNMNDFYVIYRDIMKKTDDLYRRGEIEAAEDFIKENTGKIQDEFIGMGRSFNTLYYMYEHYRIYKTKYMVIDYEYDDFGKIIQYLKDANITEFAIPKKYVERNHDHKTFGCDDCEHCLDYPCLDSAEDNEPWYLEEDEVNDLVEIIKDEGCEVTGETDVNVVEVLNTPAITFRIL